MMKIIVLLLAAASCAETPIQKNTYHNETFNQYVVSSAKDDPIYRSIVLLKNPKHHSLATGVVFKNINNNSYILSAKHFCKRRGIKVDVLSVQDSKNQREEFYAKVVYVDKKFDVCILRAYDTAKLFLPVKLAKKPPKIGDRVMTIGAPGGIFPTKTEGYVVGYNLLGDLDEEGSEANALVTSIPVSSGNSGGAIYNEKYELVGILKAVSTEYHHSSIGVHLDTVKRAIKRYFKK